MSEVTAANKETNKPSFRRPRLLRVASLKPGLIEETDGGSTYKLCYVTMEGKQVYHICDKSVFLKVAMAKLDFHKKSDFVLSIDPESNRITQITEQAKADSMVGFKKEGPDGKEDSKAVIISLWPNGSVSPLHVPERVTESTIQAMMDAICNATDDIDPGSKLGDYTVLKTTKEVGSTEIHIDPMPR